MKWVLPGGAVLGGGSREENERRVACRLLAGVVEASRRVGMTSKPPPPPQPPPPVLPGAPQVADRQPREVEPADQSSKNPPEKAVEKSAKKKHRGRSQTHDGRLATVKLVLEVLAILVGLITAILALIAGLAK